MKQNIRKYNYTIMSILLFFVTLQMSFAQTVNISTVAELEAFRDDVNAGNNYKGVVVELKNDINLSAISNWVSIGDENTHFCGVFNGNDFTISEMKIILNSNYQGLFGYTDSAEVKNLTVSGKIIRRISSSEALNYRGGIIGLACATSIINCKNLCNIEDEIDENSCNGGIVGKAESGTHIKKCENLGKIDGGFYVGGICGLVTRNEYDYSDLNVIIEDCINRGEIVSRIVAFGVPDPFLNNNFDHSSAGGICGKFELGEMRGTNENYGKISSTVASGGICGFINNTVSLEKAVLINHKEASFSEATYVGGIFGVYACYLYSIKEPNLEIYGTFINKANIHIVKEFGIAANLGGIFGVIFSEKGNTNKYNFLTKCENYGDIIFTGYNLGGIVGAINTPESSIIFSNSNNYGRIVGEPDYSMRIGGICGIKKGQITITNCHNSGDIMQIDRGLLDSLLFIGGICGKIEWGGVISKCTSIGNIYPFTRDGSCGGICGFLDDGRITNCYSGGLCYLPDKFPVNELFVGGICGQNIKGNITSCISTFNPLTKTIDNTHLGGIVGQTFAHAASHCYYDKQLCPVEEVPEYGVAKFTRELVGLSPNLEGISADDWIFAENLYPRLNFRAPTENKIVQNGSSVVLLFGNETVEEVTKNFKVYTLNDEYKWKVDKPNIIGISGNSATLKNEGSTLLTSVEIAEERNKKDVLLVVKGEITTFICDDELNFNNFPGKGTQTDPYLIENEDHLRCLAKKVNLGADTRALYFSQTFDIDVSSGGNWVPIGNKDTPFCGIYYGNDFTVSEMQIILTNTLTVTYQGLFGYTDNAEISNLTVSGKISKIEGSYFSYRGGIIGLASATSIVDCNNLCNIEDEIPLNGDCTGGIVGRAESGTCIIRCKNYGNIFGGFYAGGICGSFMGGEMKETIENYGNIRLTIGGVAGGICGVMHNTVNLEGAVLINQEEATFLQAGIAGGIFGQYICNVSTTETMHLDIYGTFVNKANIQFIVGSGRAGNIGGIFGVIISEPGNTNKYTFLTKCENYGNITSSSCFHLGGIVGLIYSLECSFVLSNSSNYGKIVGQHDSLVETDYSMRIGGICGKLTGQHTITNCHNSGDIMQIDNDLPDSLLFIGGICGQVLSGGVISECTSIGNLYPINKYVSCGGICGFLDDGRITNCYSGGLCYLPDVVDDLVIGGICGKNIKGNITSCISTFNPLAKTINNTHLGGIVGQTDENAVSHCYYDKQLCPIEEVSGYGVAKFTRELVGFSPNLEGISADDWIFAENLYPRLNFRAPTENKIVQNGSSVVLLFGDETVEEVTENFKVYTLNDEYKWKVGDPNIIGISGNSATLKSEGSTLLTSVEIAEERNKKDVFIVVKGEITTFICDDELNFNNFTGKGMQTDPYLIENEDHLRCLAKKVNLGADTRALYFSQTSDIDVSSGGNWVPIGNKDTPFCGIYDGNNFTVSEMQVIADSNTYNGLFGYTDNAEVKNLTVSGKISGSTCTGGIIGLAWATSIVNCKNLCDIEDVDLFSTSGGIVGIADKGSSVTKCKNYGNIFGGSYAGGICGKFVVGELRDTNENYGQIRASVAVGGICGEIRNTVNLEGAVLINHEEASLDSSEALYVGGIFGKCDFYAYISIGERELEVHGTFINKANIKNSKVESGLGGIFGKIISRKENIKYNFLAKCENYGNITSFGHTSSVGGIVGIIDSFESSIVLSNSNNYGKISGNSGKLMHIGGICGILMGENIITNCHNSGDVILSDTSSIPSSIGGICGQISKIDRIENVGLISKCTNTGNIYLLSKYGYCGGICGQIWKGGKITNCYSGGLCYLPDKFPVNELFVGGICGQNTKGTITSCISTFNPLNKTINNTHLGGIVGQTDEKAILHCYYDKQLCPIDEVSGYGVAKFTRELVGLSPNLEGISADDWTFAENLYPRLNFRAPTENKIVQNGSSVVLLAGDETVEEVTENFKVYTLNDEYKWKVEKPNIIGISGNSATLKNEGNTLLTSVEIVEERNKKDVFIKVGPPDTASSGEVRIIVTEHKKVSPNRKNYRIPVKITAPTDVAGFQIDKITLRFNRNLFYPKYVMLNHSSQVDNSSKRAKSDFSLVDSLRQVDIENIIVRDLRAAKEYILFYLVGDVLLDVPDSTGVWVEDVTWDISKVKDIFTEPGYLTIYICTVGGDRLVNANENLQHLNIKNNPITNNNIEFALNTMEIGLHSIEIVDIIGEKLYRSNFYVSETSDKYKELKISTNGIATGVYCIILQTPTLRFSEKIIIEK